MKGIKESFAELQYGWAKEQFSTEPSPPFFLSFLWSYVIDRDGSKYAEQIGHFSDAASADFMNAALLTSSVNSAPARSLIIIARDPELHRRRDRFERRHLLVSDGIVDYEVEHVDRAFLSAAARHGRHKT